MNKISKLNESGNRLRHKEFIRTILIIILLLRMHEKFIITYYIQFKNEHHWLLETNFYLRPNLY